MVIMVVCRRSCNVGDLPTVSIAPRRRGFGQWIAGWAFVFMVDGDVRDRSPSVHRSVNTARRGRAPRAVSPRSSRRRWRSRSRSRIRLPAKHRYNTMPAISSGRPRRPTGLALVQLGAHLLFLATVIFLQVGLDKRRVDGAGTNAVGTKFSGIVDRQLAGHGDDRALGGAIGEAFFDAHQAGHRSDVHDRPAGREQQRDGGEARRTCR